MRSYLLFRLPLVALLALVASGHTGMPPNLPEIDEFAPPIVVASATNCDVVVTSWCAYGVASMLKCKKNGTSVTLSFNSTTTNWPHANHCDKTWNVDLTPLNLQTGDVLVWEAICWATSGPNANQRVYDYATTVVQ